MTAQLNYGSTPTYSFPSAELVPPEKFIELSLETLSNLNGSLRPILDPLEAQVDGLMEEPPLELAKPELRAIPLSPLREKCIVVASDSSSIKIGETRQGVLCAIRGAIVWRQGDKYRYLRVGPLPYHLTYESGARLLRRLQRRYLGVSGSLNTQNSSTMQIQLSAILDHWLQLSACRMFSYSVVLRDGSLTAKRGDALGNALQKLLDTARGQGNAVLGLSKESRLRLNGYRISDLTSSCRPPYLLELRGLKPSRQLRLLGRVYLARLGLEPYTFRLDVDAGLDEHVGVDAVRRLLHNDTIVQGYPETLRLAHILSTFTAAEVIALQRYVCKRCGLEILPRPSIRRLLFGPYGTGWEGVS